MYAYTHTHFCDQSQDRSCPLLAEPPSVPSWVTHWPSVNTSWPSNCSLAQIPHARFSWTNTEPLWPLSRLVNGRVLQRGFKDAVALGATFSMLMAILALSGEPVWDREGMWLPALHCQHTGIPPLLPPGFHSLSLLAMLTPFTVNDLKWRNITIVWFNSHNKVEFLQED